MASSSTQTSYKPAQSTFLPEGDTNPLTVFIAWLNLDLGIETCFFHGLDGYWKTWLQFVFPFYIWATILLIIYVSHCSQAVARIFGNNSVPVLATLILLSYAKLLSHNCISSDIHLSGVSRWLQDSCMVDMMETFNTWVQSTSPSS